MSVTFSWPCHYGGNKVFLAGTFNDWTPQEMTMDPITNSFTLSLSLPPGIYQYKYLLKETLPRPKSSRSSPSLSPHFEVERWCYDMSKPSDLDSRKNINNVIHIEGEPLPARKCVPVVHSEKTSPLSVQQKEEESTKKSAEVSLGHPKTVLEYWEDTWKFTSTGLVLGVHATSSLPFSKNLKTLDKMDQSVVLTSTIFHPQGGGQPSDKGFLQDGQSRFVVNGLFTDNGVVYHLGSFVAGKPFPVDTQVILEIDAQFRSLNARLHSAGHLLDVAVRNLQLDWVPKKGYHFAAGPYVEYEGEIEKELIPPLIPKLQEQMDVLTCKGDAVRIDYVQEGVNAEKLVRLVNLGGLECPCGGTHVTQLNQIQQVKVGKISSKKGIIRLSYNLQ